MELGDLIFYTVLFGIWLFSFLAKKIAANNTSSTRKGVTFRILEFIAKLNSAAEEQANNQPAVMSQHRPRVVPTSLSQRRETKPKREVIITSKASPTHSPQIAYPTVKVQQKFSKKKMQKAIIWSEIIQPPVALRE